MISHCDPEAERMNRKHGEDGAPTIDATEYVRSVGPTGAVSVVSNRLVRLDSRSSAIYSPPTIRAPTIAPPTVPAVSPEPAEPSATRLPRNVAIANCVTLPRS